MSELFVAAAEAAGVSHNDDFNGAEQAGCGFYQLTQKDGARWSTAAAYLRPVMDRSNLTVMTGALTTKVNFVGRRAVGVSYIHQGQTTQASAEREVILSGGAINSPHVLFLSGVGPADELRPFGIDVVQDLRVSGRTSRIILGLPALGYS